MGGDEFDVIVKPEQFIGISKIIKNVVALFNRPWYLRGTEYFCTMSMGVATFPDNSDDVHEIVKMAERTDIISMTEARITIRSRDLI